MSPPLRLGEDYVDSREISPYSKEFLSENSNLSDVQYSFIQRFITGNYSPFEGLQRMNLNRVIFL